MITENIYAEVFPPIFYLPHILLVNVHYMIEIIEAGNYKLNTRYYPMKFRIQAT